MKKLLSLVLAMLMVLTAMGGFAAVAEGDRVHLVFTHWGDEAEQKQWAATCKAFTDSQDRIEVEYVVVPGDGYTQKLLTLYASGDAPDVHYANNALGAALIPEGKVIDLMPYIEASTTFDLGKIINFEEMHKPFVTEDGKLFAIHDNDNPFVIYYNKTLVEEYGFEDPNTIFDNGEWTWEKFAEISQTIHDQSESAKYGFFIGSGVGDTIMWPLTNGMTSMYDGDTPLYTDPRNIEAFDYLMDNLNSGAFTSAVAMGGGTDASQLFMSGLLAFSYAGRWMVPTYKNITSFEWDVVPYPIGPNGENKYRSYTPGYTAIVVNADSHDVDAAAEYALWFCGYDGQKQNYGDNGNCLPTYEGLEFTVTETGIPPHCATFLEAQKNAIWPDMLTVYRPKTETFTNNAIESIMLGEVSVEDGFAALNDSIISGESEW